MAKKKFVMDETPYTRTEFELIDGKEVAVNKTLSLIENFTQLMKSRRFNFQQIPLSSIIPNPKNEYYRSMTPESEVLALASSIELQGLMHNLVVRRTETPGVYMLIAGEKRHRALNLLHMKGIDDYTELVPVNLIEDQLTDEQEELLIHASNIISRKYQKEVLTVAIDKFEKLLRKQAETNGEKLQNINELISRLGEINVHTVKRYRYINKNLSARLKKNFEEGKINVHEAEQYIKLNDEEQEIAADALEQGVKLDFDEARFITEEFNANGGKEAGRRLAFKKEPSKEETSPTVTNKSEGLEQVKHDEKRNQAIEKVKNIREEREEKPEINIPNLVENSKKLFTHDLEKISSNIIKSLDKYFQREEEYLKKFDEYSPDYSVIKAYMLDKFNGGDE